MALRLPFLEDAAGRNNSRLAVRKPCFKANHDARDTLGLESVYVIERLRQVSYFSAKPNQFGRTSSQSLRENSRRRICPPYAPEVVRGNDLNASEYPLRL